MHTKDTTWQTKITEVYIVNNSPKKNLSGNVSDEQAVRKNQESLIMNLQMNL